MEDTLQSTIELALILLLVIFAVAVVVERIKLPYTIALLLAGLFGIQRGFHDIHLTPDLILLVFLPVLLFEGAYHVRARRLWENALPIGLLAIPGCLDHRSGDRRNRSPGIGFALGYRAALRRVDRSDRSHRGDLAVQEHRRATAAHADRRG